MINDRCILAGKFPQHFFDTAGSTDFHSICAWKSVRGLSLCRFCPDSLEQFEKAMAMMQVEWNQAVKA